MAKIKKTLSFDIRFIERVQAYADKCGISFSSAVAVLVMQQLDDGNK